MVISNFPMATTEAVLDALRGVVDPDLRRDIVALGFVKNLAIDGGTVRFDIELTTPACPVKDRMQAQAEALVRALPEVTDVQVTMTAQVRAVSAPDKGAAAVPGVKNVIAVGAGKGGVGKTTVAAATDGSGRPCVLKVAMPLEMDDGDAFSRSVLAHGLAGLAIDGALSAAPVSTVPPVQALAAMLASRLLANFPAGGAAG